MVTPLLSHDELDREGVMNLVEHMIMGGVHGIFILGTTGEAQSLSYRLRAELVELVCASMSQVELCEYFTALADVSPLPLYLYNMPSHVKAFLEVPTVVTLSSHPNIAGLKDSSANMVYFRTLCHLLGGRDDFALYVGPEELTGECVLIGADGGINGGANLFPELYVSMYEAASRGDVAEVQEIQKRIMTVSRSIYTVGKYASSYLKGLKCALSLMGLCSDYLEWPLRKFLPSERVLIRKALLDMGYKDLK